MVDLNPGMFFGTRGAFKSVIAARAATLIAWAAVRRGDRIGALLFNSAHNEIESQEIKPQGGQRGALRLIKALAAASDPETGLARPDHPGGWARRCTGCAGWSGPGSLVFILSDFYSIDDASERELTRLRQHNDVVACQICRCTGTDAPPPGRYGVSDGDPAGILDTGSAPPRGGISGIFQRASADGR